MADEKLPEPLTPPDCDLQDFKFMPLDVQRLRDSDLASEQTPEENWAAVLLWGASWHQVPAASLPDVDPTIAKFAGYMMRGRVDPRWKDVKPGAMRGFILCSDGRWYHPVVAEKAREAWISKLKQRLKTECARIKKHNERHGTDIPFPEFDAWLAAGCPTGQALPVPSDKTALSRGQSGAVPRENRSKGQGQGQGQGNSSSSGGAAPPPGRRKSTKSEGPTVAAWNAYSEEYERRHGAAPIRNATVNGQLAQFVARIGAEEAPAVAAFFVRHNNPLYVRAMHPVALLVKDAEGLRTQWATGRQVTERPHTSDRAARAAEAVPGLARNATSPTTLDVEARDVTPRTAALQNG